MYLDALKCIYGQVKNLELIAIGSVSDDRLIFMELDRVLNELRKKHDGPLIIAPTGMYNPKPNPPFPFPSGFYKDLGVDFSTCCKQFSWKWNSSLMSLLEVLKQLNIQHIFVHDTSSTKKSDRIGDDACRDAASSIIMLNPDRNMYESHHPYYYLAQLAVRTEKINILDYIHIMETARGLYLIDSCYFSMTALIDISRVQQKYLYKRADVKYEWLTPELGWNEILL
jgi:hypothetical protein